MAGGPTDLSTARIGLSSGLSMLCVCGPKVPNINLVRTLVPNINLARTLVPDINLVRTLVPNINIVRTLGLYLGDYWVWAKHSHLRPWILASVSSSATWAFLTRAAIGVAVKEPSLRKTYILYIQDARPEPSSNYPGPDASCR